MEDLRVDLKNNNLFNKKNIFSHIVISVLSTIFVLLVMFAVIYIYRAKIFTFFASQYVASLNSNATENIEIKPEELLSQIVTPKEEKIVNKDLSVVDIVKKVNPAVVSIILTKEVPKYETYIDNTNPFGDFFPSFFFNTPQYRQNGTEIKEIGGGSGFFVSSDGLIVTNRHVVDQDGVGYTVFTSDGKKYTAKVVAKDPVLDIALIKVDGSGFKNLSLGNSDNLEVGESVIAIGNALSEFKNTVSVGIVSGLSRSIFAGDGRGNTEFLDQVIQTDAAINPGNSGGPLLNFKGEVIGVNVAVAQGSQNVGFALPINSVKSAINSVKETGKITRPFLGIRYVSITKELKERNKLSVDYGILVKAGENKNDLAVIPGSPANKAGILENDIVLEIDGVKIDEKNNFASIIRQKSIGQNIRLKILSKGIEKNINVVLEPAKD